MQPYGCGLRLLTILYQKAANIGITEAGRIEASMHAKFMTGLTSATVLGFNDFRTTFGASNNAMPIIDRLTAVQLMSKYKQLVDRLGLDNPLQAEIMRTR